MTRNAYEILTPPRTLPNRKDRHHSCALKVKSQRHAPDPRPSQPWWSRARARRAASLANRVESSQAPSAA